MEEVVKQKKKGRFAFNFRASLCMPYGLFMFVFVILPLLVIVYYAFTTAEGKFSFESWKLVIRMPETWKVIGRTFLVSICTTVICILIAYPIAYILANKKFNKNKFLVYIFLLPMWINFVVRTTGLKELLNGLGKALVNDKYSFTSNNSFIAVVIGMVYDYLPFTILPLYNQMLKLDKSQIEAAADLGANPVEVFFQAIVPQTVPGIISACTMTFMPTMSSYVIASALGEGHCTILGNLIQLRMSSDKNAGSVLSLIMLFIVSLSLVAEKLLSKKPEERKGNVW